MNNRKDEKELDPKIRLALTDVIEARAIFASMMQDYELDGSMNAVLREMVRQRLVDIRDRLETVVDTYDISF